MTPTAIHWLLYDVLRRGDEDNEHEVLTTELQSRGATYEDLVSALIASPLRKPKPE